MSQPSLLRVVSRWEIVALSVNDVVGSGVYLLPASAALLLGPASVWAVPAAGVCVLLIVLCFAEAGSRFDDTGGAYVYTRVVQLVGLSVVPDLGAAETPLAEAAGILLGPFGIWLLTVGAVLSILGTSNNTVLAGSRYLYALAASGRLPAVFAGVHARYRTPWIALGVQTGIALPLALSGTFTELVTLSVVARMATCIGTAAAIPVLRRTTPTTPRTFRLPGGPAIPLAALLVCLVLLSSATAANLVAGAIAATAGAAIYLACGRHPQLFS